jgi:hypothetical protein
MPVPSVLTSLSAGHTSGTVEFLTELVHPRDHPVVAPIVLMNHAGAGAIVEKQEALAVALDNVQE